MSKEIFISFDYDHDRNYRYLLNALSKNPRSDLEFVDVTPQEIESFDVARIKGVLTQRIDSATHTLVIVGKHANSYHRDREIGTRNWQWWEIDKSAELGNKFVAVKIESSNTSPDPLMGKGAKWAMSFNVEAIIKAIDEA